MSMLSAQCDELRELALWLDDEFYDAEATKVRDAADTIWQLRDDLQRANAENARLRSELESVGIAAYLYGRDDLKAENAKLRELVRLMVRRHTPISPCKNIPCGECPVKDECDQEDALMRELGVEP